MYGRADSDKHIQFNESNCESNGCPPAPVHIDGFKGVLDAAGGQGTNCVYKVVMQPNFAEFEQQTVSAAHLGPNLRFNTFAACCMRHVSSQHAP